VPLAAEAARHYGAEHIIRRVSKREFRADLPCILNAMDQPSIDGVNTWFVAKAAREAGLKVALSGLGGDELLAGYPSFVDLPRWRRRFGAFAHIPGLGVLAREATRTLFPKFVRRNPKAPGMLEFSGTLSGAYLLRRGLFLPQELQGVLDRGLVSDGLRELDPLSMLANALQPDPGSDVARICALESAQYLRNQLLRDADWAGMAHSLEIRTPLVDFTLLTRLAPLIADLVPGTGKKSLAAAPSRPLPLSVVSRAKTGFSVPTGDWAGEQLKSHAVANPHSKGQASRLWLRQVYGAISPALSIQPVSLN
jgi:asparagine synthase (glutamine-hydrolysing)